MLKLQGQYHIDKFKLTKADQSADFQLIITKRGKAEANKPKEYLLLKQAGSFKYVSSLYPSASFTSSAKGDIWLFDYQQAKYQLHINRAENRAIITLEGQNKGEA
jgi:hypothetical protein